MNRLLPSLAALAGAVALVGCAGHGAYTSNHLAEAQARFGALKAGAQWEMARQQFLSGDLEKALKSVDNSIELSGSVPKSHTLRGRVLIEIGRLEDARESFDRALAIDPSFHEAAYYKGIVLERFREFERALDAYTSAFLLDPSSPQYLVAAAEMHLELGRPEQARALIHDHLTRFEHNAGVRQTLANIAMLEGDSAGAAELFAQARLLAPEDLAIVEDLVRALVSERRWTEAEHHLSRLLQSDEHRERVDLRKLRAQCLLELDRPLDARSELLGLTQKPEAASDVDLWIDLGRAALAISDLARVRTSANRAIALAPGRADGHLLLAAWREREGDLAGALEAANSAASAQPEEPAVWVLRGELLRRLDRADEAAQSLARALRLDPADGAAKRLLAVVESDG